jgi:hypothetical protein
MANMSYCRFENTAGDLQDCVHAMEEAEDMPGLDLSKYETAAYERLAGLCREFLEHDARLTAASTVGNLLEDPMDKAMANAPGIVSAGVRPYPE